MFILSKQSTVTETVKEIKMASSAEVLFSCIKEFLQKQAYFQCSELKFFDTLPGENMVAQEDTVLSDLQCFLDKLRGIKDNLLKNQNNKTDQNSPGSTGKTSNGDVLLLSDISRKRRRLFNVDLRKEEVPELDSSLVQVRASNSEIERRINAFIERKKMEVDEENKREFCNAISDSESTCARTDAVFVPRGDSKSHVKITRVHNLQGPQTMPSNDRVAAPVRQRPRSVLSERKHVMDTPEGVQERLRNIETHVGLKSGVPRDVYDRLRMLENRILFLESLSPEYFDHSSVPKLLQPPREIKQESQSDAYRSKDMNLNDINARIEALKRQLKSPIKSEPA